MFLQKNIQPKLSCYPAIGQKKLNGASARMMVYFWSLVASEVSVRWPCELYRHT